MVVWDKVTKKLRIEFQFGVGEVGTIYCAAKNLDSSEPPIIVWAKTQEEAIREAVRVFLERESK